ncbi:hypothetical protein [Streptomyces sp. NPDC096193]|uniref:hypothetical protein n=1 Tax=Streptomyces sp. NPDC096193 TaxID=3155821 RepID=UPI003328FBC3
MTDTSTEAVAAPAAAPESPPPQPPESQPSAPAAEVEHTPGGWPVLPLATVGANSTAGMVATAALAGGPIAAAIAMTGAVVLGTAATVRSRQDNRRKQRKAAARTAARTGATASARSLRKGGIPKQSRNGNAGTTKTAGRGRTKPNASKGPAVGSGTRGGKHGQGKRATSTAKSLGGSGRLGQVRALRTAKKQAVPTRAANRQQTTAARRGMADARRSAKAAQRTASLGSKGKAGKALAKGLGKATAGRNALLRKARAAKDQRTGKDIANNRSAVRKAPARKRARQALRRSTARFQGRRLLAALLALPLGLLGLLTSPLGRKFRLPFLIHPGRRLYQQLMGQARLDRAERDGAIRQAQDTEEAAADAEATSTDANEIKDQAERPAGLVPATASDHPSSEGVTVSGFNFEETAAEMESAAQQYDPESAMEILAMVESLPAALTSVANVMRVLAERSDSEFPLEKEVADGFNDIFGAVMSAVAVAEDMGPLFRQAHEQDIARHEDPRNGPEAEKGWNV